jgi:hypothetical protein
MPMIFNLYVPAEYTFESYFVPMIKGPLLEFFEVDKNRRGIQRKGNNHLIVFLDFCLKKPASEFTKNCGGEADDFRIEAPSDIKFFYRMFGQENEVSVFSLSYHGRMSVIAWEVLIEIADNPRVVVEDETGKLVGGPECIQEYKMLMGQS